LIRARLRHDIPGVVGMERDTWNRIFQQLYRDVLAHGAGRTETFNGNYGLNRGLASASLVLAAAVLIFLPQKWFVTLVLFSVAAVYLYRTYRFGVHFAREVYTRFLLLPAQEPPLVDTMTNKEE
jgi:hypothetical protein